MSKRVSASQRGVFEFPSPAFFPRAHAFFAVTPRPKDEMVRAAHIMNALLLKRFFQKPLQVAYITPSSKALTRKVASKMDFSEPRVIVEYGPGEGCHSREILSRMAPGSQLILIELDAEFAEHLRQQFRHRPEVHIIQDSATEVLAILRKKGFSHCDYIVSGIPFTLIPPPVKRAILQNTHEALRPAPHAAFITYQVSRELRNGGHCDHFLSCDTEFCLANLPPMWVSTFHRSATVKSDAPHRTASTPALARLAEA
ncbi:MAG: hypothetical protein RLZZ142_19 [Verrucomicrobiota bacterium]